jgi:methylated-DNA-[protein]-cysteine S-methyltransferase
MMTNSPIGILTPHGTFVATYSQTGLSRLEFPEKVAPPKKNPALIGLAKRWHATTTNALKTMLLGQAPTDLPPLDLSSGTEFQIRVWRQLLQIPLGQARSYIELAWRLGKPGASRAVGSACGANPIPVIVPCHRVLAAHGRIGGFSGGPGWKQRLLKIEGTQFIE